VTATQDSLSRLAAKLTDPQDRETYAALISYFRSLPAHDELFHLAQLLGFLSLLGQRLPEALSEVLTEFRLQAKTTQDYSHLLEERLAHLPQEIASGVDLDRMTQAMGESFRQQLTAVGLENTMTLLRSSTVNISTLSGEISAALNKVAQEYRGVSATIATELERLTAASRQLREHNATLMVQERWNAWLWQVLLALLLFLVGGLCGIVLEKRQPVEIHANNGPRMERSQTTDKEASRPALSKKGPQHLK
jgi:hypothetical protein